MNRLNKTQKYAIQWLYSQKHTTLDIANELEINEKHVISFLEKNEKTNEENNIKTTSSSAGKVQNKNLMITESAAKKNRGVTIMTPEASMSNDHFKKNNSVRNTRNQAIFNPLNNKNKNE